MSFPANFYSVAAAASGRLLFSLGIGTLLALVVWLLLRVFPRKDSRTSFAVWFVTLLITAVLPLVSLWEDSAARGHGASGTLGALGASGAPNAVITVSAAWAVYIFLGWAALACLGLARVAVALWQVHRLRRESEPLDSEELAPELRALVEQFRRSRSVEIKLSRRLEVPTALGFFKPAIVLPQWLLEETPAEELKYILLHELEHLRRRDDWTNLAQQMVKALLFFVPSVWWIERRLALDREMACDDAVLAQSGTPHGYAECLAKVAERSFLRRQLALAQAAVSRLRQLTVRVTRILDPNRQHSARVWKPAVPAVVLAAGLCAFSASQAPMLIGFADHTAPKIGFADQAAPKIGFADRTKSVGFADQAASDHTASKTGFADRTTPNAITGSIAPAAAEAHALPARSTQQAAQVLPANFNLDSSAVRQAKIQPWSIALKTHAAWKTRIVQPGSHPRKPAILQLSNLHAENKIPRGPLVLAGALAGLQPSLTEAGAEYVTVREEFFMVVSQRADDAQESWQVHVLTISVTQAKPHKQIPKKI